MRYERDGFSVEAAHKKGRKLAKDHWYHDRPPDIPRTEFFFEAFRDLISCRPPDGPIPWTAAMAYADRKGLAPELATAVWEVVSRMDLAERQWRYDELKREAGLEGG